MKRHPFALAFSPRRMASPDSNVRRTKLNSEIEQVPTPLQREQEAADLGLRRTAPQEDEEEVYVRITPKGRRKLEASRAQQLIAVKKALILEKLRAADLDEPVMLQNLCMYAGVNIEACMLLIFEINAFCMSLLDAPENKPFISLFFNGDSGEVWAELFEPDGAERA